MGCEEVQNQLSALLDGELDQESALLVEAHLDDCDLCRSERESLLSVDAALNRAMAHERQLAEGIASRSLEPSEVDASASSQQTPARSRWRRLLGYIVTTAAGFLLATLWYQPWRAPEQPVRVVRIPVGAQIEIGAMLNLDAIRPVAKLVHATGPIAYRRPTETEWSPVSADQIPTFACPSDASVRTEEGVLCEIETTAGSRIRLNELSEVALKAEDELELKQGQIWCRSADEAPLKVVAQPSKEAPPVPPLWSINCTPRGECVTSSSPDDPLKVVSASGTVDVTVDGTAHTLSPGSVGTWVNDGLQVEQPAGDLLDAERWMQPLLTLGGHGNPELTRRVDALLARIGRTKISSLYEQDLRNLGEYGAVPLLRFVQSESSAAEPNKRQLAMRIIADTTPIWTVPDLIALLTDSDPDVRSSAARGLSRLTGETQGLAPEDWAGDPAELSEAVARWQTWWQQHRFTCPPAPESVSSSSPAI